MRIWLLVFTALSACHMAPKDAVPLDGPFGIAKGEPLSALGKTEKIDHNIYKLASAPIPYPNIEYYRVKNTPQHGTCRIEAVSNVIASDSSGNALRNAVDKVRADLVTRYGEPNQTYDQMIRKSVLTGPQDWMNAISKNDRAYAFIWFSTTEADNRTWRGVKFLALSAGAIGNNGRFTIQYNFVEDSECDNAAAAL